MPTKVKITKPGQWKKNHKNSKKLEFFFSWKDLIQSIWIIDAKVTKNLDFKASKQVL